ncbi:hypothetical protein NDU88_000298 [Pleurodeles waltl]|uniref:Uncharacterized protein n=1 Tax=Pleurodeles waltl TaxID=8319 RepID=A0AAV7SW72_PLEWA|nr:hypothetical protein NDU88_000298 [Pleurodeles waltl]
MRLGFIDISCLCQIFASLWTMTTCMPRTPRPLCYEETTLARKSSQHLKSSLHDLQILFQNEAIPGSETGVCVPEETNSVDWSTQLDTVVHRLCQYKVCFQQVEQALLPYPRLHKIRNELIISNIYLDNLLAAFRKMKRPFHRHECGTFHARTQTLWLEVNDGRRLAQNLLGDLGHLSIPSLCQ